MKSIVHNSDNLNDLDVNRIVKRAKLIIENDNGEIILASSKHGMYLLGGHVDDNESDNDTLIRELNEEAGIVFNPNVDEPFLSIVYYNRDYPDVGINSKTIANYYYVKSNVIIDTDNSNLTEEEKKNDFKVLYIKKDNIIDALEESMKTSERKIVVRDTIIAVKEYLNM